MSPRYLYTYFKLICKDLLVIIISYTSPYFIYYYMIPGLYGLVILLGLYIVALVRFIYNYFLYFPLHKLYKLGLAFL